jgi:hypothetical protein
MNYTTKKSFTVMEIIVAATLMVSFSLLLVAGLTQNYETFQTNNIINTFQNDARLSIYKLRKEINRTSWARISITKNTPATGTDQLTFRLPQVDGNNDPIIVSNSIAWSANQITINVLGGNLVRTDTAGTTILARNVKAVTFTDVAQNAALYIPELKLTIEFESQGFAGRLHSYKTTAIINMRN